VSAAQFLLRILRHVGTREEEHKMGEWPPTGHPAIPFGKSPCIPALHSALTGTRQQTAGAHLDLGKVAPSQMQLESH
jgi:hypothetical protein